MTEIQDGEESILQEAQRLTHGPRNAEYGHPLDDYTKTAAMATAFLGDKLKDDITAAEMAALMCIVKLARHAHKPKRDNMVDLAGYAWVSWACTEEQARRDAKAEAEITAMFRRAMHDTTTAVFQSEFGQTAAELHESVNAAIDEVCELPVIGAVIEDESPPTCQHGRTVCRICQFP